MCTDPTSRFFLCTDLTGRFFLCTDPTIRFFPCTNLKSRFFLCQNTLVPALEVSSNDASPYSEQKLGKKPFTEHARGSPTPRPGTLPPTGRVSARTRLGTRPPRIAPRIASRVILNHVLGAAKHSNGHDTQRFEPNSDICDTSAAGPNRCLLSHCMRVIRSSLRNALRRE